MKKTERKETANKGFSLVELIVVVAIMAVLIGVLAPQYLRYVEKTRLQKDNSAIAEIANSIKIAMADETINSATTLPTTLSIGTDAAGAKTITFDTSTALGKELAATVGSSYTTSSNAYKNSAKAIDLEISADATTGVISIKATDGWIEAVGDAPAARANAF